jgi:mannose-6-phosphate isomerase
MDSLYPMLFKPVIKDYIWGGRRLVDLGRELPETGRVAESWEISGHPDGMTTVINGIYAGKTLQALLDELGADLVGTRNQWALDRGKFPLLVKLLDANKRLSVQVHPDDAYALAHEGNELGKTEMWVVLQAEPDAAIIYGLERPMTANDLREAIRKGRLDSCLHRVPIRVGDHICVPAGTLHALLEGSVVAEVQQNSNTTYRAYDWNRKGADGKPRALHLEKALDVINYEQVGEGLKKPEIIEENENWRRERLCSNRYFTTERFIAGRDTHYSGVCDGSTLEIWGALAGRIRTAGLQLEAMQFCLLPAALGEFTVEIPANSTILRTYTGKQH